MTRPPSTLRAWRDLLEVAMMRQTVAHWMLACERHEQEERCYQAWMRGCATNVVFMQQ